MKLGRILTAAVLMSCFINLIQAQTTGSDKKHMTALMSDIKISEFRFRGSGGSQDEFIELYNTASYNVVITSADKSGGWALVSPSLKVLAVIPNGTVVPAGGYLLIANSMYDPTRYMTPSGQFAFADFTYTGDLPDDGGVALFRAARGFNVQDCVDAVGFTGVRQLFREGEGLKDVITLDIEHSFSRSFVDGYIKDSFDNYADFRYGSATPKR